MESTISNLFQPAQRRFSLARTAHPSPPPTAQICHLRTGSSLLDLQLRRSLPHQGRRPPLATPFTVRSLHTHSIARTSREATEIWHRRDLRRGISSSQNHRRYSPSSPAVSSSSADFPDLQHARQRTDPAELGIPDLVLRRRISSLNSYGVDSQNLQICAPPPTRNPRSAILSSLLLRCQATAASRFTTNHLRGPLAKPARYYDASISLALTTSPDLVVCHSRATDLTTKSGVSSSSIASQLHRSDLVTSTQIRQVYVSLLIGDLDGVWLLMIFDWILHLD